MSNCHHDKCTWKPLDNAYCKRHQRQYQYNDAKSKGRELCRFFFRGCNNDIESGKKACSECLSKKFKDMNKCNHDGCEFHPKDNAKYCMKHSRDEIREKAVVENINYCDIDRGCYNICEVGRKSCSDCLSKAKNQDSQRREAVRNDNKLNNNTDNCICVLCKTSFKVFNTLRGKPSKKCATCYEKQVVREAARPPRNRNYKEERAQNPETHYSEYKRHAAKRGLTFHLTQDEFNTLVQQPCYYCTSKSDTEVVGIDRKDNARGYELVNCMPCCEMCNMMKGVFHHDYFIYKSYLLSTSTLAPSEFFLAWSEYYTRTQPVQYNAYKKEATEKRKLGFELDETQFANLTRSPCYLCGFQRASGIGIDRVDNTIRSYTYDNCRSCCGPCNIMKNAYSLDEIRAKCTEISVVHPQPTLIVKQQAPQEQKQTKWTALSLYYQLQAGLYSDFKMYNSNVIETGEIETYIADVKRKHKTEVLEVLKTYLKTLNARRAHLRNTNSSCHLPPTYSL